MAFSKYFICEILQRIYQKRSLSRLSTVLFQGTPCIFSRRRLYQDNEDDFFIYMFLCIHAV